MILFEFQSRLELIPLEKKSGSRNINHDKLGDLPDLAFENHSKQRNRS